LAGSGRRIGYWRRHVLIGVSLTEVAAITAGIYTMLSHTGVAHHRPVMLLLVGATLVATPFLMALPLEAMLSHSRGALFFYAWSIVDMVVITIAARVDGGGASPLTTLLFLTLAYMALAYPPSGVVVVGAVMTLDYLFVICPPHITLSATVVAVVMGCFSAICALASANSWEAHDAQQLLLRTEQLVAATDPLTGVLNRRAFFDRLRTTLAGRESDDVVVCLIDLDRFKAVNDSKGHAAGDAALIAVAHALGAALRETDTVARLGGDEFAVLATSTTPAAPANVAERLREAVTTIDADVTASIGAVVPIPGEALEDVLHRADMAMYQAKSGGGNSVCFSSAGPPFTASPAA
jgi:diguanylate cyclase (GGDEF)-like protein